MTDDNQKKEQNQPIDLKSVQEAASVDITAQAGKDETKEKSTVKGKKKKKISRQVSIGNMYVKATYNNTLICATDQAGNTLGWSTAGFCGFKGPKKSTPYAAGIIVKNLAEKIKDTGLRDVHVFVQGIGSGREAAVRAINANGLNIMSIKDITPLPHNGCKPKKQRRV